MSALIAPSILAADFNNLGRDIDMLNRSQADWIHCDIMDGVFVPNISFGFPVIEHVSKIAQKPLDVHLMIVDPDKYISKFKEIGAEILTVHYEACPHLHRTLQVIRDNGMKAGISINPHTSVKLLENVLDITDMVLIMTVNPGFGGQEFIENSYNKITELREMIDKRGTNTLIQVDGGVNEQNIAELYKAGVDIFVAGSFVFNAPDQIGTIASLKQKIGSAR